MIDDEEYWRQFPIRLVVVLGDWTELPCSIGFRDKGQAARSAYAIARELGFWDPSDGPEHEGPVPAVYYPPHNIRAVRIERVRWGGRRE